MSQNAIRLGLLTVLAPLVLTGCSSRDSSVDSHEELAPHSQAGVEQSVQKYIQCTIATSIQIDDGERHAGRLAWTASELCEAEKLLVIQTMSESGATHQAALIHASDSQVRATAAGIDAIQNSRAGN